MLSKPTLGLAGSKMNIESEARQRSAVPMPICSKVRRKSGKTIRQLCEEKQILPADQLLEALDPWRMTEPHD